VVNSGKEGVFFQTGDDCPALSNEATEQHVLLQLINSAISRPAGRVPVHRTGKTR